MSEMHEKSRDSRPDSRNEERNTIQVFISALGSVSLKLSHLFEKLSSHFFSLSKTQADSPDALFLIDRINTSVAKKNILKSGPAQRVIFFYPGEEGTYVDNVFVTLFENGVLQLKSGTEETTTHLRNCEVLWRFQAEEDRTTKIRLLKPKSESRKSDFEPPVPPSPLDPRSP